MYISRRNNERNDREERKNKGFEKKDRRDANGYISNGIHKEYNNRIYDDSCKELLQMLVEVSSEEASLTFKLYKLREEAKYLALELSGLLSQYKLLGGDYKEFRTIFNSMFEKYVEVN
ncbi:hypothetical protein Calag_0213 [Caldisphaera lagunensis DSM 15908]|uniref:Uncharacterized protein n=1 Tax=Caldisphaera lagunensis (strain DSM 15908 / JCM 11604 / ANMR 0165 / IC-154) TaxID=1056495 RepID=L0AAC7_CALLD|nr:hypothetical protein [Caldisphaera lagunensis]AFZ69995.1 hypothetical protein Calag_0213 [Caldisphaera lagunensis DSM 15908]